MSIVDNYLSFIANPAANVANGTWDDLLDPRFKGKLQYSSPGQAGDGTAVLLLVQHLMGDRGGLDYLAKLQANNVGPSSSTGKLQPKVSNGELLVANGDVQMNLASVRDDGSKFDAVLPRHGGRQEDAPLPLPYVAGVAKGAPHADNAKKLLAYPAVGGRPEDRGPRCARRVGAHRRPRGIHAELAGPVTEGVEIWHPDWNAVLAGLDANIASYQKITGS